MKRKDYSVLLFVCLALGASACNEKSSSPTPLTAPEFSSLRAYDISQDAAVLEAEFSGTGVVKGSFQVLGAGGESLDFEAEIAEGKMSVRVDGLKHNCEYSAFAEAFNTKNDRIRSESFYFHTSEKEPELPDAEYVPMEDGFLKNWILARYDKDGDGRISQSEAETVTVIELCSNEVADAGCVKYFPSLTKFHAEGSVTDGVNMGKLGGLDLSSNEKIEHIYVCHNRIEHVKFPAENRIVQFEIVENKVPTLDLSSLKHAMLISVTKNNLSALDISGLDELIEFHCDENPLETITLENKELETFTCYSTKVKVLDFSKCPKLNNVDCTDCPLLEVVYLAKNQVVGNMTQGINIEYK